MDAVLLSRIQFALTIGFHFIFPPLTIGMAWIIVYMMSRYKKTGSDFYRNMARFWIKLFGISFAVGVATGITMEFQFGTNWAAYSRFVGDIFGAPLAAEAIIAFFLESTFLAILLLGWNKVSVKVHLFSAWMVALGSTISAFWIIVANSWQQTPAGYHLVNGRAELTSFAQAVFNPSTMPRFLHTLDGALITGAMFMMGISAWFLLKKRNVDFARESLKISLVVALFAALAQGPLGHYHAVQVAQTQPAKMASFEGLFTTQKNAPATLFCLINEKECVRQYSIEVPGLLSFLIYGDANREVQGLDKFDKKPPLMMTFYSFHFMVILGMYFIGLTGLGLLLWWRKKLFDNKLYLRLAMLSIPLPFIANELGWVAAEVGRQPWIVYNLLETKDAISVTVPAVQILISIVIFALIYALLFAAWMMILKRELVKGPDEAKTVKSKKGAKI